MTKRMTAYSGALVVAALCSAVQADPIILGTTPNLQTAPIVVALDQGYFREAGVEIELVNFTSGRAALEAILGGQLDMAFMAEYPVAVAALNDQDFKVVTVLSRYTANRIVSKASVGFNSVADLEGKKIGTTLGSNANYFTEVLLDKAGVTAEIVNVAPPDIVPALVRGDIDAGVMFPDFYPAAADALGDDYREQISPDYVAQFVISASPKMLETREGEVEGFLSALIKAETFIKDHPTEAQAMLAKASQGALSVEAVAKAWSEAEYEIVLDQSLLDLLVSEGQWVVKSGMVSGEATPELMRSFIATEPLAAVDASRVTLAD